MGSTPALLAPVAPLVSHLVITAAADSDATPPEQIADAVAGVVPDEVPIEVQSTVAAALDRATELAGVTGSVVVAGSLYVAGDARIALGLARGGAASPAHRRFEAEPDWLSGGE
jgi:dihydrofolate synthase/folylpolyglutamate synthase